MNFLQVHVPSDTHLLLLIYSKDDMLLKSREMVLSNAGFRIATITHVKQIAHLPEAQRVELGILCHSLSKDEVRDARNTLRQRWPEAIFIVFTEPRQESIDLPSNEYIANSSHEPAQLVAMCRQLLSRAAS